MNSGQPEVAAGSVARLLDESRWLSGLARGLVKDPGLADDLVQETLVSALASGKRPEAGHTRGWLATILRRKLISRRRQEVRRGHRERDVARGEALPSVHDVEVLLESERLLRDALAELGEPYRRVVTLRYREGLSAAEIARRDGEPAGTVRSRLRTGLQHLRERLEERDRDWSTALVPLAALSLAPGTLGGKAAGTASMTIGIYAAVAAVLVGIALPLGWMLSRGPKDEVALPPVAAAEAPVAQPPEIEGVAPARGGRVEVPQVELAATGEPAGEDPHEGIVPGVISMTVVDQGGLPISGAFAQRWDDDHVDIYSEKKSDAGGRLEVSIPGQRQPQQLEDVVIRAPGWAAERLSLNFRSGQRDAHREVALSPAGIIHGTVHDPLGLGSVLSMVFVSPLPDELIERLEGGALLVEVREEMAALEFHGVFEASDRETGEFWLRDVGVGVQGQVIALHDGGGGRMGWSDVVALKVGAPIDLDPIVVRKGRDPKAKPDAGIRVRVILPEGADPDGFEVWGSYTKFGNHAFVPAKRSAPTEYLIPCDARQSLTVSLEHKEGAYHALHQKGVTLSTGEVVFNVTEVELEEVEVVDGEGNPVDAFEAHVFAYRMSGPSTGAPLFAVTGIAGKCSIRPPAAYWCLRIVADGGIAELGPFPSATYPGPHTIELVEAIVYRGILHRDGQPCPGAKLTIRAAAGPGKAFLTGEIRTRATPGMDAGSVVTGSDGTFQFPALMRQPLILGVEIGGAAVGTFELGEEAALALVVSGRGTVTGTVEAVHGEVTGGVVTVSHALGMRRSAPFGPDGTFRFDDLPAGQWVLGETHWSYGDQWLGDAEGHDRRPSATGPQYYRTIAAKPVPERAGVGISVTEGERTVAVLRVQTEEPVRVSGRVLIDGRRPRGSKIRFRRAGDAAIASPKDHRSVRVKRKGDFEVSLEGPGRWRLESTLDLFSSVMWVEFVAAAAMVPQALDVDFLTGTLILTGVSEDVPFSITVDGPALPGLTQHALIVPLSGGAERQVMEGTLAGEVTISRMGKSGASSPEILATGTLTPGGTLELNVR